MATRLQTKSIPDEPFELKTFKRVDERLLLTFTGFTAGTFGVTPDLVAKYAETVVGTVVNLDHLNYMKDPNKFYMGKHVAARVLNDGQEAEFDVLIEQETAAQLEIAKLAEKGKLFYSPELLFTWEDKARTRLYKVEFTGGGLTEHPMKREHRLKRIEVVAMSENEEKLLKKLNEQFEKRLEKMNADLEDAKKTIEEVETKNKELEDKVKETETPPEPPTEDEKLKAVEEEKTKLIDENRKLKTKSIREQLASLKGLEGEEFEKQVESLAKLDEETLKLMLEMAKDAMKQVTIEQGPKLKFPTLPTGGNMESAQLNVEKFIATCNDNKDLMWNKENHKKYMDTMAAHVAQVRGE